MWLHSNRGSVYGMPVADDDIRGGFDWICSDTRRFSNLLLRAKESTVSHMSIVAFAEAWHNEVLEQSNVFSFPPIPGDLVVHHVPVSIGNKVSNVGADLLLNISTPLSFIGLIGMGSAGPNMLT